MSATQYLNELETERRAIEAEVTGAQTRAELIAWWERLGEWWRKRDLGFGDGSGTSRHCFNVAERLRGEQ